MSNQIRVSTQLQVFRDSVLVRQSNLKNTTVDTTSELYSDNTQLVGTTHELMAAGDVTDDAFVMVENLSSTATVEVGGDDSAVFVSWISIPPGYPPAILPTASSLAATYLKSSEASTSVRVTLVKIVAPA